MKTTHSQHHHNHPPKHLKPPNRTTSLFSCGFFRHCTDSPLSPASHTSPPFLPPPPLPPPHHLLSPPPPKHHPPKPTDSESSSSSSTSQSFTQWRFPPTFHQPHPPPSQPPQSESDLRELFHVAELNFTTGTDSDRLSSLHMLEHSLGIDGTGATVVPTAVMSGVISYMKEKPVAKSATKILLTLCLEDANRRVAVECGAAARVVDALPDLEGPAAERALAALDLMCTVTDGAAEVRGHALTVPMLVAVMGRMEGRGREYAISVLAAVYGGVELDHQLWTVAPPEEVARAVMLAMQQGSCSARGKRKGAQLLKTLQENGRLDLTQDA